MIYLDTNVLVYSFCKNVDDLAQKQKAQDILKNAISTNKLLLSEISLYEFSFVCKKLEEDDEVIKNNLIFLLDFVRNRDICKDVIDYLNLSNSFKHSFDSYHITFANKFNCKELVTFDTGFKKFMKNSKTKITVL